MAIVEQSATAIAGGAGSASVVFNGPASGSIEVDSIAILVTGGASLPTCSVYDGPSANAGRVRATTRIGDRNTFTGQRDLLYPGQQLFVQWLGVTPGASCNAILRGVAR